MARNSVAAEMSFWLARGGRAWIVDVEVSVDAIAGLSAKLTRAFAARGGLPGDGGPKQPHRAVLRELGLKLARLSQLCVDVGPPRRRGGRGAWPRSQAWSSSRTGGNLSVTGFCRVSGIRLIVGDHDATLPRGVVAPGAGVIGVVEPVVHGVK
jgi:hypothetical protein